MSKKIYSPEGWGGILHYRIIKGFNHPPYWTIFFKTRGQKMKNLTPLEAIRKRCKECLGYEQDPKECDGKETEGLINIWPNVIGRNYECPLWLYRTGSRPLREEKLRLKELGIKILSPIKAIKEYCLRCCNGDRKYLKNCPSQDCPLWVYRFGKNPHLKGKRKKPIGLRPIKIGVKNGS